MHKCFAYADNIGLVATSRQVLLHCLKDVRSDSGDLMINSLVDGTQ